jgi:tryptophan 2-monooxygenase
MQPEAGQILTVAWQAEPDYYGAFKLNLPGQDYDCRSAYFQFQTAGTAQDTGVYLAGDGVSWTGGWTEGALETGLNAVCAVAERLGGGSTTFPNGSPLTGQNPTLYDYAPKAEKVPPPVGAAAND